MKKKKEAETKLQLKELVRRFNKSLGFEAIKVGAETNTSYIYRRPCGIFSIDLATAGGLPVGTMIEIAGPEGAGKNLLSDLYIAKSQEIFGDDFKCFILAAEYKYDKLRAIQNGVKVALTDEEILELEQAQGSPLADEEKAAFKKQVGEFYFIEDAPAEKLLDAAVALLGSGEIHIGVIDSLANLIPEEEAQKDLDDSSKVAARASMLTRFMQKTHPLLDRSKTLVIALNQVRAPIGHTGKYVPQYKISEPYAVKHGIAGRIEITTGASIRDGDGNRIGKELRWHISKGKAGFHEGPSGILTYMYDSGINIEQDFVECLLPFCERAGAWYTIPSGERFQGKGAIVDVAKKKPEWVEKTKKEIYEKKGIRFLYREVEKTPSGEGRKEDRKRRKRKANT